MKLLGSGGSSVALITYPLYATAGSAALPTYTFVADPNTGMYSPGADALAFTTGGVQRLLLSASGLVTVPGSLTVSTDLVVAGDLTVSGTTTQLDTLVNVTEQWTVTNAGTGPAVVINQTGANDILDVQDDGTSVLYIEDGGDVGIGTSSPVNTLHVDATTGGGLTLEANTGVSIDVRYRINGVNKFNAGYNAASHALTWYDNVAGAERMRLDSSGNVGIGNSSLESWASSYTALQIGGNGAMLAYTAAGDNALYTSFNAYFDGTWKYQNSYAASKTYQYQGTHIFDVAPSGTADAAIAWTTAMIITNDGNVGIGNSSLEDWESPFSVLQFADRSTFGGYAGYSTYMLNNAYYDTAWRYQNTDQACSYEQLNNGTHIFAVAPSGTADAAITWTSVLTLSNTGIASFASSANFGGVLTAPAGTAALPAFSFVTDPNTGIYRVGADSLGISTAGANRVTVGPGVQIGAPTGGDKGAGTINTASGIYENGVAVPTIETGTFNLTLHAASGSGHTYNGREGEYTKIGRLVHISAYFRLTALGTLSGGVWLTGLPFPADYNDPLSGGQLSVRQAGNLNITANQVVTTDIPHSGGGYIYLYLWDLASGTSALQASELTATSIIRMSGSYMAAS